MRRKSQRLPGKEIGVDWIILTACILGFFVVLLASVGAGEAGLAAHVGHFVVTHATF